MPDVKRKRGRPPKDFMAEAEAAQVLPEGSGYNQVPAQMSAVFQTVSRLYDAEKKIESAFAPVLTSAGKPIPMGDPEGLTPLAADLYRLNNNLIALAASLEELVVRCAL